MTRYFDLHSTVLIVVGHGLLPEEEDRPIAYELKRLVNTRAGGADGPAPGGVTDVWIMNKELGHFLPALAPRGPRAHRLHAPALRSPAGGLHTRRPRVRTGGRGRKASRGMGNGSGGDA